MAINGKKLTHYRVSILRIINELSLSAAALTGLKSWERARGFSQIFRLHRMDTDERERA